MLNLPGPNEVVEYKTLTGEGPADEGVILAMGRQGWLLVGMAATPAVMGLNAGADVPATWKPSRWQYVFARRTV